jgi:uncharacterized protein with FMN-binding domain
MALDVGADLWHMSAIAGPDVNFINPETGLAAGYYFTVTRATTWASGFAANNMIMVGGDGTRFANETVDTRHGYIKTGGGTYFRLNIPIPAYVIFDETARNLTPLYLSWSKGMVEEIEKGWVIKANTIQELAGKINIDPANLAKTITTYNQYCAQGNDPDFHVDAKFLKPLETGPYYAIPIKASLTNTQGGARRDVECQVLDLEGKPIPHLYSAGEFGSFYTDIYNGGGNLSECAVTGRTAGANAAKVKKDVSGASVLGSKTPVDLRPQTKAIATGAGEYLGTGSGMGGDLTVKVKLDGTRIVSVEIVKHNETAGISDRARTLVPAAIVSAQNTQVDTVSGATLTSRAIIQAVNDALSKAK